MSSEVMVAIFISVASFAFTIYQWFVTMNTRKPRLIVTSLRPERMSYSHWMNFFRIYLPRKWFVVNQSDLPNSLMHINLYAKHQGKWIKGEFRNPDWRSDKNLDNILPVSIDGHKHTVFEEEWLNSGKACYFQFEPCLTEKELVKPTIKVEMEDQYGVVHKQILTAFDIRPDKVEDFPGHVGLKTDREGVKLLTEIKATEVIEDEGHKKRNNYTVYAIYHEGISSSDERPSLEVEKKSKSTTSPWLGDSISIKEGYVDKWKESSEPRVQIDDWGKDDQKIYLLIEDGKPKKVEIELGNAGKPISEKIDLPQKLVDALTKKDEE